MTIDEIIESSFDEGSCKGCGSKCGVPGCSICRGKSLCSKCAEKKRLMGEGNPDASFDEEEPKTHKHKWGPVERSRFAGTVHRKCQVPGCKAVSLD